MERGVWTPLTARPDASSEYPTHEPLAVDLRAAPRGMNCGVERTSLSDVLGVTKAVALLPLSLYWGLAFDFAGVARPPGIAAVVAGEYVGGDSSENEGSSASVGFEK